jgi:phage virion morphogenesis (putative tail completion) protein
MSGVSLDFQVTDHGVRAGFTRLITVMGNTTPVMAAIGTGLVSSTHRRFVSQTSPDGAKWAPLNPEYRRTKRNSRILTESGRLRDSINARPSSDAVRVGTNVLYAGVQQGGATIEPVASTHLVFRMGDGFAFAKSVTIPARPFLGISEDDEDMIADTVMVFLRRHT